MSAPSTRDTSFALRIAQLMHKSGIASFPRNYELLYEAYSGHNSELLRDFVALGNNRSQAALDELGRKYVPHHHEQGILTKSNKQLQDQMESFLSMLEQEKTSLSEYGQVIGAASETLAAIAGPENELVTKSIQVLSVATQNKATKTEMMTEIVQQQAQLAKANTESITDFERMKFLDPLTGLGNRRAFNKALARVYTRPEVSAPYALAFLEIDRFANHLKLVGNGGADALLQNLGVIIRSSIEEGEFAGHLDDSRFVFLANMSDPAEAERHFEGLRQRVNSRLTITGLGGQTKEPVTISVGFTMADYCDNGVTLQKFAETAMVTSMRRGGNQVTQFKPETGHFGDGVDRMLYR